MAGIADMAYLGSHFRSCLRKKKNNMPSATHRPQINLFLSLPSPYLIEVLNTWPSVDSFTIDHQHGQFDPAHLRPCIRACAKPVLVRLPNNDPVPIGKALDYGATGLICPLVTSAEDTRQFVSACYYPPFGQRSYGPVRVNEPEHYLSNNQKNPNHITTFAMIETASALEQVEAIAQVPRLTGLYIGPFDLSLSLGLRTPGRLADPDLQRAIDRVFQVARANHLRCGIFCPQLSDAQTMARRGFDLISIGTEEQWIKAGAQLINLEIPE